jgi:triphosphoribosyl-dephospho-CoA synthetase
MKFKIEVDIDYLSEDGSIDGQIQDLVAQKIVDQISEKSTNNLTRKAETLINDRATVLVDGVFSEIMNKEINITDNWGNVQKSYSNTAEMIKARFDKFLLENVDNEGRSSSYGGQTRLDLIISKQLNKIATEFTQKAVKEVTEKIRSVLSDDLKLALGDRLINMMEIDKILHSKKLNP